MIRQMLVAFDGSEHSRAAWRYAMDLAHVYQAGLRVISVVDARVAYHPKLLDPETYRTLNLSEDSRDKLLLLFEERRWKLLDELRQQTEGEGVAFRGEVAHGIPAEVICLEETQVDLIAMGHRGESPTWQTQMLGSNAEAVIRQSTKPVLVSRSDYKPVRHILACYDGSEHSTKALYCAAHLAEKLGTRLTVLSVNRNIHIAEQTLAEVEVHLRSASLHHADRAASGLPAECILKTVETEACELIVMGVYGHSVVRTSLIGHTTEEIMRRTPVALLLVK